MIIKDLNDLDNFAKTLSEKLNPYDVLVLDGDLGAGKTQLTKFICKWLNISQEVQSPTFPIVYEYEGDVKVFHFDLYRLNSKEELFGIGFDDYLNQPAISIIEWGSKFKDKMPSNTQYISLKISEHNYRELTLSNE